MLEGIETLLLEEKPDKLLVYGDTNSTVAGALAAKKIHVPVGHIEAGLRSFNMRMPEEINRILTDRISDHLFCPTDTAIANLKNEGFEHFDCKIHRSGDVMQDAALFYAQTSAQRSTIIADLKLETGFVLSTIHRAENTDEPLRLTAIVNALNAIHESETVVCPLHPRTRKILDNLGLKTQFHVIDPVGYFDMIELLKHASLVMTDSGGLQKEAFFFKNPCVTMRDQTEWTELVDHGFNILASTEEKELLKAYEKMRATKLDFNIDLYGGGNASEHITNVLTAL